MENPELLSEEVHERFTRFHEKLGKVKDSRLFVRSLDMLEKYTAAAESGLYDAESVTHLGDEGREEILKTVETLSLQLDQEDGRGVDRVLADFESARLAAFDAQFDERMHANVVDAFAGKSGPEAEEAEAWQKEGAQYELDRKDTSYRSALDKVLRDAGTENGFSEKDIQTAWKSMAELSDRALGVEMGKYLARMKGVKAPYLYSLLEAIERRFETAVPRSDRGPSAPVLGRYSSITQPFFKKPQR